MSKLIVAPQPQSSHSESDLVVHAALVRPRLNEMHEGGIRGVDAQCVQLMPGILRSRKFPTTP